MSWFVKHKNDLLGLQASLVIGAILLFGGWLVFGHLQNGLDRAREGGREIGERTCQGEHTNCDWALFHCKSDLADCEAWGCECTCEVAK